MEVQKLDPNNIPSDRNFSLLSELICEDYPCVMAQAMLKKGSIFEAQGKSSCPVKLSQQIRRSLADFERNYPSTETELQTFIFYLPGLSNASFEKSEKVFWGLVGRLLSESHSRDTSPSQNLEDIIRDPNFSLKVNNVEYFLIFLHPKSPRKARRLAQPAIVFNRFSQFESLRDEGVFEMIKKQIRERDKSYSGSVNPMVADHGESSEILQYSGRDYSSESGCPFQSIAKNFQTIPPRSGMALKIEKGDFLTVFDPEGEQVSDLFCFNAQDRNEYFSSGRTIDYNSKLFLGEGDYLYSSESRKMLKIMQDDVGRHDLLLTPCSSDTFKLLYEGEPFHRGCQGNLIAAFKNYDIDLQNLPSAFNIFMNVTVDSSSGQIEVLAPKSKPGDKITFQAQMDLIVGLTACSAPMSNAGVCKKINFLHSQKDSNLEVLR